MGQLMWLSMAAGIGGGDATIKEHIVAKLVVDDAPRISAEDLEHIDVKLGEPVVLKLLFEIGEKSGKGEGVTILFSSDVNGQGPEPAELLQQDYPVGGEAISGHLTQRHAFPARGTFVLVFKVAASEDIRKGRRRELTNAGLEGSLTVTVA